MAFIPTPFAVRACFQFVWQTQQVEICIAITRPTGWNATTMAALAGNLKTWWNTNLKPLTSSVVTLNTIKVTDVGSATGGVIEYVTGLPIVGTGASPSVPNNVTIVTTFITLLRGRSYRGRVYHVGIPSAQMVNSVSVNTTYAAALTTAWSVLNAALDVANGEAQIVISLQNGGAPRITGASTPISSYRTEINSDSQRRRLAGRGI